MNWNWTPSLIHFVSTIRTVTLLKLLLSFSNKKKLETKKNEFRCDRKKIKELFFAVFLNILFNFKTDIWNSQIFRNFKRVNISLPDQIFYTFLSY